MTVLLIREKYEGKRNNPVLIMKPENEMVPWDLGFSACYVCSVGAPGGMVFNLKLPSSLEDFLSILLPTPAQL